MLYNYIKFKRLTHRFIRLILLHKPYQKGGRVAMPKFTGSDMKKRLLSLFLIFVSLFLFSCKSVTDTSSTTTTRDADEAILLSNLDTIFGDAADISNIYGISVYKNDEFIASEFYGLTTKESKNNVYSVTKSITSLLLGIAIDMEYIESVDQTIGDFIDLSSYENQEVLSTITIKNLITMSAGLVWDSSNLAGEMSELRTAEDPLALILERDIEYIPGTNFNYSDGAAHLMSIIISQATGMSAHDFAKEYLFTPLSIFNTIWNTDRLDNNIGGCDLYLSHEDMYKIAKLVLNRGEYEGTRIVSATWIDESTATQIPVDYATDYGFYWWITSPGDQKRISARGWGGQQIYIVPEENIIVITSADGWVSSNIAQTQFTALLSVAENQIIPLLTSYDD